MGTVKRVQDAGSCLSYDADNPCKPGRTMGTDSGREK